MNNTNYILLSIILLGSFQLCSKSITDIPKEFKTLDGRQILYLNDLDLSDIAGLNDIKKYRKY